MARARKAPVKSDAEQDFFDPISSIDAELDGMEKRFKLSSMAFDKNEPRFSTGLLCLDVMLAGGMLGGGWYTTFGGEQSCKSTLAMTILSSIMAQNFHGVASYFDYEGSSQSTYIENIMRSMGVKGDVERVFGVRDDHSGGWAVPPTVRYYAPDTGEKFFNYLAKLGKVLPDKVRIGDNWYYVYDNTRENQKMLKGKYDKEYFSKTNRFRVPARDGGIQAIILTDSYPAMLPGIADEKDEGDKSMALQARMFSDGMKRVKGMMRTKRIVVVGVNQLRKIPAQMYGPTEQEPCGEALRFYSDVRIRMSSVSIPHGKGYHEEEKSVVGEGDDLYRYVKMKTHKNKLGGLPNQAITLRIVEENAKGDATGFCLTWDAFQYLKVTGQIGGTRKKIKFLSGFNVTRFDENGDQYSDYVDFESPLAGKSLSWHEFKTLIEGSKSEIRELCTDKLKMERPMLFRNYLKKQVQSGQGYKLLMDAKRANYKGAEAGDANEVSVDDDDDD